VDVGCNRNKAREKGDKHHANSRWELSKEMCKMCGFFKKNPMRKKNCKLACEFKLDKAKKAKAVPDPEEVCSKTCHKVPKHVPKRSHEIKGFPKGPGTLKGALRRL